MSCFLPHLPSGWHVDEAIKSEEDRVVVIRFGHDWDPQCMTMDETLYGISEKVQNFAVIYLVDIPEVPDSNKMYELYDPCTVMYFYRNKHIMIDLGTGNNNKIIAVRVPASRFSGIDQSPLYARLFGPAKPFHHRRHDGEESVNQSFHTCQRLRDQIIHRFPSRLYSPTYRLNQHRQREKRSNQALPSVPRARCSLNEWEGQGLWFFSPIGLVLVAFSLVRPKIHERGPYIWDLVSRLDLDSTF